MSNDEIVFDTKLMKPACVLLQAAHGCDPKWANHFDSRYWLTNLTPDMKLYPINGLIIRNLVDAVVKYHLAQPKG